MTDLPAFYLIVHKVRVSISSAGNCELLTRVRIPIRLQLLIVRYVLILKALRCRSAACPCRMKETQWRCPVIVTFQVRSAGEELIRAIHYTR